MKFYKKFDNYLLTHQPLLWHSMFLQHTAVMIGLNLVFFAIAFFSVDLSDFNSNNYYKPSHHEFYFALSLFWFISGLTIIIVWGAHYFRHNAGKNFYPISKWYFQKLALFILIPLFIFSMVPLSYMFGIKAKAHYIVPSKKLEKFMFDYAIASPLLINNLEDYHYSNRIFPEQYKNVKYWDAAKPDSQIYAVNGKQYSIQDLITMLDAKPIHKEIYAFQYKQVEAKSVNENVKIYENRFQGFYSMQTLPDFHEYHIKNFNPFQISQSEHQEFLTYVYNNGGGMEWLKTFHDWMDNNPEKIKETLYSLRGSCEKYEIGFYLDIETLYSGLLKSNFDVRVFSESIESNHEVNIEYDHIKHRAIKGFVKGRISAGLLVNDERWDSIFWMLAYMCLAATVLILYFEWGSVKSLLIAVPIGGGIIIVLSFLFAITNMGSLGTIFIIMLVAGFILFLALKSLNIGKSNLISDVALVLSYFFFSLWFMMIVLFVEEALDYTRYWIKSGEEPLLSIIKISPFILFLISLGYIKKILAKKE